jgi:hypothetical protein
MLAKTFSKSENILAMSRLITPNNTIDTDSQKRRVAPFLLAGYGER